MDDEDSYSEIDVGYIEPLSNDPQYQPGPWTGGPTMNDNLDDYVDDGTENAFPIQPGQAASSTGFFDSLSNALGGAFQNIAGNAVNQATGQLNQAVNSALPATQQQAQAAQQQAQQKKILTYGLIAAAIIGAFFLYKGLKK